MLVPRVSRDFSNPVAVRHSAHKHVASTSFQDDSILGHKPALTARQKNIQALLHRHHIDARPDSYSLTMKHNDFVQYRDYHIQLAAHRATSWPLVEGPLRGPITGQNGVEWYGKIEVRGDKKQQASYAIAREHLSRDPKMRALVQHLEDGTLERHNPLTGETLARAYQSHTVVNMRNRPFTLSNVSTQKSNELKRLFRFYGTNKIFADILNQINWNPKMAVAQYGKSKKVQAALSPATGLGHEMVHRFHTATEQNIMIARVLTPSNVAVNREEALTIKHEAEFATNVGEKARTTYAAAPLFVKSVLDTQPTHLPMLQHAIARQIEKIANGRMAIKYAKRGFGAAYAANLTSPEVRGYAYLALKTTPTPTFKTKRLQKKALSWFADIT